jgi:hypothetical protein
MKAKLKDISEALRKYHGVITPAAQALGISYNTLYKRVQRSKKLQEVIEMATEGMVDIAENKLMTKIVEGDNTMIIFYLKCKGKKRGYVEKQELDARVTSGALKVIIEEDKE